MKKILLTLFITISFVTLNAQQWCTAGSQWHFDFSGFSQGQGYRMWTYLNDTTIAGHTCNKIHQKTVTNVMPNTNPVITERDLFTYKNNQVVYIKDVTATSTATPSFDTLFYFNAAIGGKWRMAPTSMTTCATSWVTVLDTGRKTIQGQSLKWLYLNYTFQPQNAQNPMVKTDTVYERIGALKIFPYWPYNICPNATDGGEAGSVRCFLDQQINTYKPNTYTGACEYLPWTVGITKQAIQYSLKLYPNPAADQLHVAFEKASVQRRVQLVDVSGRMVMNTDASALHVKIDTEQLQSGIYFLQVKEEDKLVATQKVVKE